MGLLILYEKCMIGRGNYSLVQISLILKYSKATLT